MRQGIRIDLHIHSKYSDDGLLDPCEVVRIAQQRGLNGVAITDHNTIRGGEETKRYEADDFVVVVGAEITTDRGEITGLFLSREVRARCWRDVIEEIKAQGGIVVVPHPFDGLRRSTFRSTDELVGLADAVEGFNSRCVLQRFNREALRFADQHNLPVVAGSDAHFASEIGLGGVVARSSDIRKAIADNNLALFGTRSPLLNHARTKACKLWRKATGKTMG